VEPRHIKCPSCGAGKNVHNPGIVTVVCEYCGTAIYWDEANVNSAGRQSILPEGFSRLYRGACGNLKRQRFMVTGRVRYSFGRGFWDEWFLEFEDGSIGWLTEDNHEFALQRRTEATNIPNMEKLRPGSTVMVNGMKFRIHEVGEAKCIGMEGDLPVRMQTGETYRFADGSSMDGAYVLGIEFDNAPPTVYTGKWLEYSDMTLDDEGLEW
jgi:hypothetical protein